VQGGDARWRRSVSCTTAVECSEFYTEHVQLGSSAAELHGDTTSLADQLSCIY